MKYEQYGSGSSYPYPNNDIDPAKKDAKWCMEYAKAAYYDFSFAYPKGIFANNGGDYQKNKLYALGKQPNTQYKKWLGVDSATNNTWLSNDWSIRAVVSTLRDKSISRLMKEDYGIVCTPIDILAKTEVSEYYSDMKAKLAVRQLMIQQNPELASHPLIMMQSGEPLDVEELEMRIELGEQFNRSKDAEMAIELGLYENDYTSCRRAIYEDLFDCGVAGFKDWLGEDNKPKFRRVNPENVVISYSKDGTFSDLVHAGEQIDVPLVELATVKDKEGNLVFTEKELEDFASTIVGKFNNPTILGRSNGYLKPYDKFKCKVLDIEFFTYNTYSYNDATDEYGNSDFRKAANGRGKSSPKYKRKKIQYVYKCKWVVGTDKCYDWGMCYDQKRSVDDKKKAKTKLSYHFRAYNYYEMKAQSFMDRLIPYLDEYQLTIMKVQNFKNRAVPSGFWIDLDGLENIALTKGGASMQPKEILQMFFDTGILMGRSKDAQNNPMYQSAKPIIPIENSLFQELVGYFQDLQRIIGEMERIVGYNDATLGQANPKTLVPGYEMAQQSTSDALYPLAWAEESLSLSLAEAVMCRTQQGLRKGGISGYAPALNTNTLRFIDVNPELSLRDYGIVLQKRTTDDQKMWLLQQMQADIQNGFLDTSDAVMLVNTKSAKEAQMIWAYRVRKGKERAQQYELQKLQMQSQGNAEVAAASEQAKQQTIMLQGQIDFQKAQLLSMTELKKEEMRLQAEVAMKQLELQVKDKINLDLSDAKRDVADTTAEAKIISSQIDNQGKAIANTISGEAAIAKQEVANAKPQPKSSSKK
jgi:hypothetical protein